jgi:hypothetical protein
MHSPRRASPKRCTVKDANSFGFVIQFAENEAPLSLFLSEALIEE